MANEVFYSASGDIRLSEVLAQEYQLLLADRFSLLGHPSIVYAGNCAQSGSAVVKVPLVGLAGYDRMAAIAENASATNTALTDSSATITVARQALQRQISDLNSLADSRGIGLEALVADGLGAYVMRWMEMLASLVGGFTATAGTSGADLTAAQMFTAQFSLMQAGAPGPYLAVIHPQQLTDFLNSARSEAGPWQYRADAQDLFTARGHGIVGSFNGTDIVASKLVPTANAGADRAGGMFARGAIGYADGTPVAIRGAGEVIFPAGTRMFTEIERDASAALTKVVHNAYLGFAELQDSLGVSIITDA